MPSIAATALEMVQLVLPEHANPLGTLYGGVMMDWITEAATMAAMKVARGSVVLGSMDDLDFVAPVAIGDLVVIRAQVEHIGRASLEVGVAVRAENPRQGGTRLATASPLAMVAVDDAGRPRPAGAVIEPATPAEEALAAAARARKAERDRALLDRAAQARRVDEDDRGLTHAMEVSRIVFPEDAVLGTMMFAGRLMRHLDEAASILALRYCRGPVVTASMDALAFYAPIHVGEIVTYQTALNHVGRTSMEVGVRVLAEQPLRAERRHTCTAFITMVHLAADGPRPVPPYTPRTDAERRRWVEAERRRAQRLLRRARFTAEQA